MRVSAAAWKRYVIFRFPVSLEKHCVLETATPRQPVTYFPTMFRWLDYITYRAANQRLRKVFVTDQTLIVAWSAAVAQQRPVGILFKKVGGVGTGGYFTQIPHSIFARP